MKFESALKILCQYISEIYEKNDVKTYTQCIDLHNIILQSARIDRQEFFAAFKIVGEELKRRGEMI